MASIIPLAIAISLFISFTKSGSMRLSWKAMRLSFVSITPECPVKVFWNVTDCEVDPEIWAFPVFSKSYLIPFIMMKTVSELCCAPT